MEQPQCGINEMLAERVRNAVVHEKELETSCLSLQLEKMLVSKLKLQVLISVSTWKAARCAKEIRLSKEAPGRKGTVVFFPTISASDQVSPVSIEISTLASSRSSVQAASDDVGLTRWNGLLEYEDEPWNTSASSQAADDEFAKKRDPKSANDHKLEAVKDFS